MPGETRRHGVQRCRPLAVFIVDEGFTPSRGLMCRQFQAIAAIHGAPNTSPSIQAHQGVAGANTIEVYFRMKAFPRIASEPIASF